MNTQSLTTLLDAVHAGEITVEEAVEQLRLLPFADLGYARVDHHRELRTGFAEAVFGEGKTPQQTASIVQELLENGDGAVLVTRASDAQYKAVLGVDGSAVYSEAARLIVVRPSQDSPLGSLVVAAAGTSDLPVAEEASLTAQALGAKVERLNDVGVAGVHRLLRETKTLREADVVIVVAGMEGALASLVGGLVSAPVIAVPTSVGYGAGAGGITPLLAMLNSCAPGVAVVNIDNGFGAAVFAATILNRKK